MGKSLSCKRVGLTVENVEADKDEIILPSYRLQRHSRNVGVIEVGSVIHDDMLRLISIQLSNKGKRKLTMPMPVARVWLSRDSAQYVGVKGVYTKL